MSDSPRDSSEALDAPENVPASASTSLEIPTPIKRAVTTYKGSARKKQAVKRPFTRVVAREDSDEEMQSVDDEEVALGKPSSVSARRQGEKPSMKSAKQAPGRGKVSSPVGSEGSELTDIEDGEREDGDEDDKKAARAQAKTSRGRSVKTTKYAESDDDSNAEAVVKRSKTTYNASGRKAKQVTVKEAVNGDTEAEEKGTSDGSLSPANTEMEDADVAGDKESDLPRGQSARKTNQGKMTTTGSKPKPAATKKGKDLDGKESSPLNAQNDEPAKSKRRKVPLKSDDAKPPAKRNQPASNGSKKNKKPASTTSLRKATASTRKGKASLRPQSSTQLTDPFYAMFGSSQLTTSRIMTDSESSDGDERQKVSRLFAGTSLTPQKRKGNSKDGQDVGGKRQKGKERDKSGGDTDASSTSEEEPAAIEFRRDLTALDGTHVYCKNGRLGLHFGGIVVGYDDLKDVPHAKKKKFKDGIYLIKLPVEQDKVFRKRRDEFFTEHDEEFATCTLGETAPVPVTDGPHSDARERLSTPPLPLDVDQVDFETLDYMVQLQAIRGHLERIIREEYPPAQDRIDVFWMRGKKRSFPQWYGNISAHHIDEIWVPELTRWAIRPPLRRQGSGHEGSESSQPARPTGSARYEELNEDERELYVRKILLNEAIIYCCIKTMNLEQVGLEELMEQWGDEDLYPEVTEVEPKTAIMRDLVARKELDQLALDDPDSYSIWATLMQSRNEKRKAQGLPLEGEKAVEAPVKERGGRAARARNNVSYRE